MLEGHPVQGLCLYEGKRKRTWKYKRELWRDGLLVTTVTATLGHAKSMSPGEVDLEDTTVAQAQFSGRPSIAHYRDRNHAFQRTAATVH